MKESPKPPELLRVCAWCARQMLLGGKPGALSIPSFAIIPTGVEVTHGLCVDCQERYFPLPPLGTPQ